MKELKKLPIIGTMLIIWICIIVVLVNVVLPIYRTSENAGKLIGDSEGKAVGLVIGSYSGFTEGYVAGQQTGLSAEDTTSELSSKIQEVGNLEVLVAGVRLKNYHSVGKTYSAIYMVAGDAVFTVDMTKATVGASASGDLMVLIPKPEVTLYIDEAKTRKLGEQQKKFFDGDAKDGFTAYLNSAAQTVNTSEMTLVNDKALMQSAEQSAIKQVEMIVRAMRGNDANVHVSIEG